MIPSLFAYRHALADVPGWFIAFVVAWLFFVGGSIGSFLNVVIYRLPRGMSVAYPGSRCPTCKNSIAWYDNLPVISWCLLRGRCRHCDTSISPRYVLVELLVAFIFVAFACLETFSDGANLPHGDGGERLRFTSVALWGVYALQMLLMAAFILAVFVVHDRFPVPTSPFIFGIVCCLIAAALWPNVMVIPLTRVSVSSPWIGVMSSAAGLLAGLLIGGLAGWGLDSADRPGACLLYGLVGAVLGWQAVIGIGVASLWFMTLAAIFRKAVQHREIPWPVFPTMITVVYIAFWNRWSEWIPMLVAG